MQRKVRSYLFTINKAVGEFANLLKKISLHIVLKSNSNLSKFYKHKKFYNNVHMPHSLKKVVLITSLRLRSLPKKNHLETLRRMFWESLIDFSSKICHRRMFYHQFYKRSLLHGYRLQMTVSCCIFTAAKKWMMIFNCDVHLLFFDANRRRRRRLSLPPARPPTLQRRFEATPGSDAQRDREFGAKLSAARADASQEDVGVEADRNHCPSVVPWPSADVATATSAAIGRSMLIKLLVPGTTKGSRPPSYWMTNHFTVLHC